MSTKQISTIAISVFGLFIVVDYGLALLDHRVGFSLLSATTMLVWLLSCVGSILLIWERSRWVKYSGAILVAANPVIVFVVTFAVGADFFRERDFWFGLITTIALLYMFFFDAGKKKAN